MSVQTLYLLVTAAKYLVNYRCISALAQSLLDFKSHWFTFAGTAKGWCMKTVCLCHFRLGCRSRFTLLWLVFNPEPSIMKFFTNGWISVLSPLLLPQLGADLGGSPAVSNVPDFIHLCLLSLIAHQYFACWLTDGGWFWCSTSYGAPGVQCPCERWPGWPLWPWRWSWHAHGSVQPSKNSEFWVGRRHIVKSYKKRWP